jgi:hypothetical protein
MIPHADHFETSPLSALELLQRWSSINGPDLGSTAAFVLPGTLALRRQPIHSRYRKARRTSARLPRHAATLDGSPHESVGVTTVWSANAPPALASA